MERCNAVCSISLTSLPQAVEEVFNCPGYIFSHFAADGRATATAAAPLMPSGARGATTGGGAREAYPALRRPGQLPPPMYPHGLDAAAVQVCVLRVTRLTTNDAVTHCSSTRPCLLPCSHAALLRLHSATVMPKRSVTFNSLLRDV